MLKLSLSAFSCNWKERWKYPEMALNVPGLIVMAGFYILILGTGIWASMRSRKEEKKCAGDGMEITLLAGRKITLLVGIFTLTGKDTPQTQTPLLCC